MNNHICRTRKSNISHISQTGREIPGMEKVPDRTSQAQPKSNTTRTDKKAKKRWSKAEKEQLIFCFYVATKANAKGTRHYRKSMRKLWLENKGDPEIGEQALADMKQSIIRSKYFTDVQLKEIEVRAEAHLKEGGHPDGINEGGAVTNERHDNEMQVRRSCRQRRKETNDEKACSNIIRQEIGNADLDVDADVSRKETQREESPIVHVRSQQNTRTKKKKIKKLWSKAKKRTTYGLLLPCD